MSTTPSPIDFTQLAHDIKSWGRQLGFQEIGISDTQLTREEHYLQQWLARGNHGEMDYMARHGALRARPAELVPGTLRIITARLNYQPPKAKPGWEVLDTPDAAYISRYALGRDYHKVLRTKLQKLADRIQTVVGNFHYRAFTDSAPVMEVALAQKSGLGWRGKHTLLLSRDAGSLFFLGELFTDLPLPTDEAVSDHCGSCRKCIDICPTQAITGPYQLDARRCISYLTIEHKGVIPEALRPMMGNRIYGCDDCQLICPWNKYARLTEEADFQARHGLDDITLLELFAWSEAEFNQRLSGSAIRRIGYTQWLRNIAVALGNALREPRTSRSISEAIVAALRDKRQGASDLLGTHIDWALAQTL
ncbi:MAG: tRNA epoxyqueuosine(34) reductase QueG [Betaproteobacteria bacterium]|nr:tRNA epoxyqueuosine(34) reductase QueG [Betaproteobacteria bacterium]